MDAEVEAAVEVPPPVPVPHPDPLERLVRDMTEQLKRDRAEAPQRRLVALKQYDTWPAGTNGQRWMSRWCTIGSNPFSRMRRPSSSASTTERC